jgi:hypothetical protein
MDTNRKGKIKLFQFADYMGLYLRDPKNSTKLLDLISVLTK